MPTTITTPYESTLGKAGFRKTARQLLASTAVSLLLFGCAGKSTVIPGENEYDPTAGKPQTPVETENKDSETKETAVPEKPPYTQEEINAINDDNPQHIRCRRFRLRNGEVYTVAGQECCEGFYFNDDGKTYVTWLEYPTPKNKITNKERLNRQRGYTPIEKAYLVSKEILDKWEAAQPYLQDMANKAFAESMLRRSHERVIRPKESAIHDAQDILGIKISPSHTPANPRRYTP